MTLVMMQDDRTIRVVFLPNVRQREKNLRSQPGMEPDWRRGAAGLARHGIAATTRDLNRFPTNPLANRGTFYAGFDVLRACVVLARDRRVDVIVSVFETNVVFVLLLAKLLRFRPRIVLWEVSAPGWRIRDRVLDFVLPRVDRVLVLTRHQKMRVEATWRPRAPVDTIGFAVDDTFFRPIPVTNGGYILAVGDDAGRDYATLIEACRDMPWRLVLRTGLTVAIPAECSDRMTVKGRVSYVELRTLYAAASVVVTPLQAVDHPSGITAVYEAMAMGRPVVATEIGSTRDVIGHGQTGLLVQPGDAVGLRGALKDLMGDEALRVRLGRNARAAIESAPLSHVSYIERFAASLRAAAES